VLAGGGPLGGSVSLAAAVSLPTATFALSGTVAKTSAVFLRRQAPVTQVAVARVHHVGYLRQGGKAAPDPAGNELPTAAAHINAASTSRSPLVAFAPPESIRTLDPSRLDPDALAARQALLADGGLPLSTFLRSVPVRRSRVISTPYVSVLHIDDLGTVDWTAAAAHTPTTPGILASTGDLIVSLLNPSKLRAAVLPMPVQASAEFGVFTTDHDPYAVLGLLYSPLVRAQLRPLGTGTSSSRRRIDAEDVLSVIVPAHPALPQLGQEVREAQQQIAAARARLTTLYGP